MSRALHAYILSLGPHCTVFAWGRCYYHFRLQLIKWNPERRSNSPRTSEPVHWGAWLLSSNLCPKCTHLSPHQSLSQQLPGHAVSMMGKMIGKVCVCAPALTFRDSSLPTNMGLVSSPSNVIKCAPCNVKVIGIRSWFQLTYCCLNLMKRVLVSILCIIFPFMQISMNFLH